VELIETLWWHPDRATTPEHAWLRRTLTEAAASLPPVAGERGGIGRGGIGRGGIGRGGIGRGRAERVGGAYQASQPPIAGGVTAGRGRAEMERG
jgi:hypothetical protein